jgi:hypothetical protein
MRQVSFHWRFWPIWLKQIGYGFGDIWIGPVRIRKRFGADTEVKS